MTKLLVSLLAFPLLAIAQDPQRVVKPEIRKGDSWIYRTTDLFAPGTHDVEHRVSFANGDTILVVSARKGDDKEADNSWTAEWNAVKPLGDVIFRPSSGVFRFPLHPGDRYDVKYELLRPKSNAVASTAQATVTVSGWETVEVPAGKFRALKVQQDGLIQPLGGVRGFRRLSTFWYVPDVRRWVKLQVETPTFKAGEELLEFKLNED